MIYNPEITGKIIKTERKKLKLTQAKLGKKLFVSGKQVSNYERGELLPPDSVLTKMCELFGCEKGYLLGEADYSNKTRLYTDIYKTTGISESSIKNILYITGDAKDSIDFGYNHSKYRKVFDSLLSSAKFCSFIETLYYLEELSAQSPFQQLINDIGEDRVRHAIELETDSIDYRCDPEAPKLTEEEYSDLNKLDASIDADQKLQYEIRVARYSVYEAFESLINDLYPKEQDIKCMVKHD